MALAFLTFEPPLDVEGSNPVICQLGEVAAVFPRRNRGYDEATVVLRSGEKVNVGESTKDVEQLIRECVRAAKGGA